MSVFDRIKNIMTIPDDDEYEDDELENGEEAANQDSIFETQRSKSEPLRSFRVRSDKSSAAQQTPQVQVVLVKPDRFDDVTAIADHLNEKRTVVLNLENANRELSRRIIDFLGGVAYANHGTFRKVATSTYIIAAHDVGLMGELLLDDYGENKFDF